MSAAAAVSEAALLAAFKVCVALFPVAGEAPYERLRAHAATESRFERFAVGVNEDKRRRLPRRSESFATLEEAVAFTRAMLADRRSVDVGVLQVNLAAHPGAFASLEDAFSVVDNTCAAARILGRAYQRAKATSVHRLAACEYNTGRQDCSNGYPEKVDANEARLSGARQAAAAPEASASAEPRRPPSDFFARRRAERGLPPEQPAPDPLAAAPTTRGPPGRAAAVAASFAPGDPFRQ